MPELPEVEAVRQLLLPVMRSRRIGRVTLHRDGLRRRFDPAFVDLVEGQRVDDIVRRGKHLLVQLGSGDVVALHLGMSGDFRIEPRGPLPDERRLKHDHVVIELATGTVVFSDPRRFGAMDLLRRGAVSDAIAAMGPEPLSADFTPEALARALAGRTAIRWRCSISGSWPASATSTPARRSTTRACRRDAWRRPGHAGGAWPAPRARDRCPCRAGQAIARRETAYRAGRFRVYEREGRPCRAARAAGSWRAWSRAGAPPTTSALPAVAQRRLYATRSDTPMSLVLIGSIIWLIARGRGRRREMSSGEAGLLATRPPVGERGGTRWVGGTAKGAEWTAQISNEDLLALIEARQWREAAPWLLLIVSVLVAFSSLPFLVLQLLGIDGRLAAIVAAVLLVIAIRTAWPGRR